MANKPLPYRPAAVPTHLGWAHEKTGEQLTSHRNLEPAEGTEYYQPNNRKWMAAYNEGPADLAAAPENTAVPTITGTAKVGSVLTGTTGTWTGRPTPTTAFQWLRDGANISGATSGTYTLVAPDAGKVISLKVTATNSEGSASATSTGTAAVTRAPANTAVPTITGTTALGDTLTGTTGTWTGRPAPTFTRQWTRNGTNIAGATATTYVITAADQGTNIAVKVTGTNSAGNATATSANTAVPAA